MLILSIDDSRAVHAFLDRSLQGSSFRIMHAFSGLEGVQAYAKNAADIKAVLLDWEMPDLDGPGTLRELQKAGIKAPVIMLTTKNRPDDIQAMLSAGVTEYIMKPFTPDILLEKLRMVVDGTS